MQGRISKNDQYKGSDRNPHHTYQHGYNREDPPRPFAQPQPALLRKSTDAAPFHHHPSPLIPWSSSGVVSHDSPCVGSARLVFFDPALRVALQPLKPQRGVSPRRSPQNRPMLVTPKPANET